MTKNHGERVFGRKLGFNWNEKTFREKLRSQKIYIKKFELIHPNLIKVRYCLLGWAQTAQWQECKFALTSAKIKIFWKKTVLLPIRIKTVFQFSKLSQRSLYKCSAVQQPVSKQRNVHCKLLSHSRSTFVLWNEIKYAGCRHPLSSEHLILKTVRAGK